MRAPRRAACGWGLAAALAISAAPAVAQQGQESAGNPLIFELLSRLEQLEQELRQLRGDLEVQRFQGEDQARRIATLEARLAGQPADRDLPDPGPQAGPSPELPPEGAVTPELPPSVVIPGAPAADPRPAMPAPPPAVATPASPAPDMQAQRDYDDAFGRLRDGQFEQAATAFEAFVRRHPDSALTPNALYWLGESHYVNREFDQARQAFARLGAEFPRSDRVPDALLKLGYVSEHQGDAEQAVEIYRRLQENFPDHPASVDAAARLDLLQ